MPRKSRTYRLKALTPRGYAEAYWHVVWYENRSKRRKSLGITVASDPSGERSSRALAEFLASQDKEWRPDHALTPSELSISRALAIYLEERGPHLASPETAVYTAMPIDRHFDGLMVSDIRGETCRGYAAKRRKDGSKDGSIARELDTLSAALNYCANEGYLTIAPKVTKPPRGPARDRWLTHEEAHRLIKAAKEPHVRMAIRISLMTGQRITSVLQLGWLENTLGGHVDLDAGIVRFLAQGARQTNKKRATQKIQRSLLPFLLKQRQRSVSGFVVEYRGAPVQSIKKGFAAACKRAGLEGVTPHTLKHTSITWLVQAGLSLEEVAAFTGTSTRTIERVYWHHSPHYQEAAANAL